MSKWKSTRTPPTDNGPIWIRREIVGFELGEFSDGSYLNYGASADREGLGVEAYSDVTHWAEVEEPPFDYVESLDTRPTNQVG
jgi:hypothetical protein